MIDTARLRLRAFTLDDVAAVHAIHSRDDITRWLYWDARDEDEVRAMLESHLAKPPEAGVVLAIERDGELIGHANLAVGEHRQGEIGFMLHPDHQGHGYATEAAEAMLELAFETLRPAPRGRPPRAAQHGIGSRARAARHAQGGAPDRERVGQGRVAERGGVRDPRSRMAPSARASLNSVSRSARLYIAAAGW